MALYRRKETGVWYADFFADGKRVQESTRTRNRREAEKFLALRVSEAQGGVYAKPVLGHSTVNTTVRYAHSNHETKARAVAKLPTCDISVTVVPRKAKKLKIAV